MHSFYLIEINTSLFLIKFDYTSFHTHQTQQMKPLSIQICIGCFKLSLEHETAK